MPRPPPQEGEVTACPECDSTGIHRKNTRLSAPRSSPEDWYCRACGTHFDHPDIRERHSHTTVSGLAKVLHDTDPEEVFE